jgi:D-lactate dehydrogenase
MIGTKGMLAVTSIMRFITARKIPRWSPAMPKGIASPNPQADKEKSTTALNPHHTPAANSETDTSPPGKEKVVYLPSCMNRVMGASIFDEDKRPLWKIMVTLLKRAGYDVTFPENFEKLCCGMSWDSKGFKREAMQKAKELEAALLKASENGRYMILCDQSPCLYHMWETMQSIPHLYEPVAFIDRYLLDRLSIKKINEPVAIHITCSTRKMELGEALLRVANACSENVLIPDDITCCGFAGDKGFTHPELNRFSLRKLRAQIKENNIKNGYSNSRTCEIGLSEHSGIPYQSIAYLVEYCSRKEFLCNHFR